MWSSLSATRDLALPLTPSTAGYTNYTELSYEIGGFLRIGNFSAINIVSYSFSALFPFFFLYFSHVVDTLLLRHFIGSFNPPNLIASSSQSWTCIPISGWDYQKDYRQSKMLDTLAYKAFLLETSI